MQRPNWYLESSGKMTTGKRGLDPSEIEEGHSEKKRPKVPALASVIVEALKADSLQKILSSLEPVLRRVVSEEVEHALAKLGPARLGRRSSPKRIEGPDGRNLQLHFSSRLSLPSFTGGKVEGKQGGTINVELRDANTGHVVRSSPESSLKLDVVVLEGDFNNEDDEGWTQQDFENHVVKEREGKRPLLTGDLQVTLKEGVGTLGEFIFTDNSSWLRSKKFRLGLKVASGFCEGIRVREAKTDAFTVRDHRGELYKKHYPPKSNDAVWRLEKIGKDGSFHKKLNEAGIHTVEQFLRLLMRDSQSLRTILGGGVSNKIWEILVKHSKTCVPSGKLYYYSDDRSDFSVVFNSNYALSGFKDGEQYFSAGSLSDDQKVYVDTLVKRAYENWMHIVEYDGKALVNFKQRKETSASQNELLMGQPVLMGTYPSSFDHQASQACFPVPVPSDQASVDSGLIFEGRARSSGYNENMAFRFPTHSPHINPTPQIQFENTSITLQGQLFNSSQQTQISRNDNMIGLALGPPQSTSLGFDKAGPSGHPSDLNNSYDDLPHLLDNRVVNDYFPEEEDHMRNHEMFVNPVLEHFFGVYNMGDSPVNVPVDGYPFSPYMPASSINISFDDYCSRSSGRSVVGWLKLKAALRWGIFIRKQAAEKRAHLVELDCY